MVKKSRKSRPRKCLWTFSDAIPHDVLKANRTKRRRAMILDMRDIDLGPKAGLAAQQRDLKAAGVEKVFSQRVQRGAADEPNECLEFLSDGDALTVTKPDRLARSTTELLTLEADLSKRGVGLVVQRMGGERLDTRNPTSKLMLTILAGVESWEREFSWNASARASARRRLPANTRAARSASTRRRSGS